MNWLREVPKAFLREGELGTTRTILPFSQLRRGRTLTTLVDVMSTTTNDAASGHCHAVRFYEDEQSLYQIASDFIGDGLVAGQPAVVIATPVHRDEIARGLEALSCDVTRMRVSGQLLMLDARETLLTFMKDGYPQPEAFHESLARAIDSVRTGRPRVTVRAYGEMVDCLWKDGRSDAAIRLEVLWNELGTIRPFSLLCGYSVGNFYKHGAYEDICRQHTHVLSEGGHPTRIGVA